MKCEVTGKDIEKTFLGKIVGTTIRDAKGKKHFVSADAQAKLKNDRNAILSALK